MKGPDYLLLFACVGALALALGAAMVSPFKSTPPPKIEVVNKCVQIERDGDSVLRIVIEPQDCRADWQFQRVPQ